MKPFLISLLAAAFSATLLAQPTPPPAPAPTPFAVVAPMPQVAPMPPTPLPRVYNVDLGPRVFRGGYLGVSLISITPELRRHFGAANDSGILISRVEDGSPAAKAGLHTGDVIVSIDGEKVDSAFDLGRHLREKRAGGQVKLEFIRDRARQQATVTVTERERRQIEVRVPDPEVIVNAEKAAMMGEQAARAGEEAARRATEYFDSNEWKTKMRVIQQQSSDCDRLQERLKEVEMRLKELEKKLDK